MEWVTYSRSATRNSLKLRQGKALSKFGAGVAARAWGRGDVLGKSVLNALQKEKAENSVFRHQAERFDANVAILSVVDCRDLDEKASFIKIHKLCSS